MVVTLSTLDGDQQLLLDHFLTSFLFFSYISFVLLASRSTDPDGHSSRTVEIDDLPLTRRGTYQRRNSLTELHEAVLKNCEQSVRQAISSGVPIDLVDHAGHTALYYACERGLTDVARCLLELGALSGILDRNQRSTLWIAAKEGHQEIVLLLLQNGINPNERANDGTTAVYHSSYAGHLACVEHLVQYGACVNSCKNSGASPLFVAARNGHDGILSCLLAEGGDPNRTQKDGRSPIQTAILHNQAKCLELLLERSDHSLLDHRDIYGWSNLHFLAKNGKTPVAEILFHHHRERKNELRFNEPDAFGNTALHIALFQGHRAFAEYLIERGSSIDRGNRFQLTVRDLLHRSEEIVPLTDLVRKKVIPNTAEVKKIAREIEQYVQALLSHIAEDDPLFRNTLIRSGSFYEGTKVDLPDEFDYMINLDEIQRLSQPADDRLDPVGFTRLSPQDTPEARERLSPYLEPITGCLSSEKIRQHFYRLLTSARAYVISKDISQKFEHLKFEWTSGDKRCGTAINAEYYGYEYPYINIKIDVVPCVTVDQWPRAARIACPFQPAQFHLIARSPQVEETHLWRVSTSRAGVLLFSKSISRTDRGLSNLEDSSTVESLSLSDRATDISDGRIDHLVHVQEHLLLRNTALFTARPMGGRGFPPSNRGHSRRSPPRLDHRFRWIIFHRKLQCHRYGRLSKTLLISNQLPRRPSFKLER